MDNNKKISIVINTYPTSGRYPKLMELLGDKLCCFYGQGMPRGKKLPDFLKGHVVTTKIPSRITGFVLSPILNWLHLPKYNKFLYNVKLLDFLIANKVAHDESDIILVSPLLPKTIERCKKNGKLIVVEAGNSEPEREHNRIMSEYKEFNIKHKYIYGDARFKNTCLKSLKLADKIITISKVSHETYLNAGYREEKLKLVPLTGTDMPLQAYEANVGKEKAFITTAFHNFIKGTQRLLLAWQKAGIKDIPLIVAGRLCEDLQEFVERYGPFDNVEFVGHQSNLRDLYITRDAVGVLLSLSEGAGRVTPEMMSFGYPMIVSPDATCDLIKDGYNGYIIEPTDVDAIAQRLKWFAEDWSRVHALRKNVLSSVEKRTMDDYSIELAAYLESL